MDLNINKKTNMLVISALMMALILITTMMVKVPIPMTRGYVHLGDAMIFISMMFLSRKYGLLAAGAGSALADVFGGFAAFAPWTFLAKGGMVLIAAAIISLAVKGKKEDKDKGRVYTAEIIGMICGGVFMVVIYYLAESIMVGNWFVTLAAVPWNIGQFAVGMAIAFLFEKAISATPARKYLFAELAK